MSPLKNRKKKKKSSEQGKRPSVVLQIINKYLRWLLLLVFLMVFFIGYSWQLNDKFLDVKDAAQQNLPQKQKILDDLRLIKDDLDSLSLEYHSLKQVKRFIIQRLEDVVPLQEQYLELFGMLDDLTQRNGFTLQRISFAFGEAGSEFVPVTTDAVARANDPLPSGIGTISVSVTVEGGTSYESYKSFLDAIERSIRIFDIRSVDFSAGSENADPDAPDVRSYDFEFVSYYDVL